MHKRANIIGWLAILLNAGAQLILAPVIKLRMGADGLGVWHLLFQTYCYLQLIDLGFSNGITKEISSFAGRSDLTCINNLMVTAQCLLSLTGIFFCLCGVCAVFILPRMIPITEHFNFDFALALSLLSLWGLARYHYSLPLLKLRGFNRIVAFNWVDLVQAAGRPLLGVILAFANLGLIGITAGYAMAEAGARWIAHRLYLENTTGKFDVTIFKRIFHFGWATSVISLSTLVTFYSSSFIIGWKLGIKDIATYQSSIALPCLCLRFAILPFTNRLPSLIYAYEADGLNGLMHRSLRSHIAVISISTLILACVCTANSFFVRVWVGTELFAGYEFTLIYGVFLFFSIVRHNGYMVWQATGNIKNMMFAHLFEIPTNIGLSFLFIDMMGLKGIAYAFMFASIPSVIISQWPFISLKRTL
jgi:O-antigen/teichoic acid export membrane protein